ncbi:glycosyltransferase family 2 protein [Candidatus Omnitrophota bacterium]
MKVDILILNYNGKDLLEKFLPSVCKAARESSHPCRVHVIDNVSSDGSVDFIKQNFPEVVLTVPEKNRVLCSYNDVVERLDSDVVIFLNNDMKAEPDFVDSLVKHFEREDVMFAAPRIMNFDGTYNGGKSVLRFSNGAIKVMVEHESFMEPGVTQAISTGAFRRKHFVDLGGFDDLYLPGIWEDVDICFRGLLKGRRGVYEPSSVIWHDESTTFHREYGKRKKMRLAHRNMFLFFWKNITDLPMFLTHALLTPPRVVFQYLKGNREPLEGLFMAFGKMGRVLDKRRQERAEEPERTVSQKEIIS